jgi:septal ring factor EnvC (AmiA/AmiB activator)
MWPRVLEQMQMEVIKEQKEKKQLKSQLTIALNTLGKHEQQIQNLNDQLFESQAQVQSKDQALEEAQAKIIELAVTGGSSFSEEALDAIKQTHEKTMTEVTSAHGQRVELLNIKATELES